MYHDNTLERFRCFRVPGPLYEATPYTEPYQNYTYTRLYVPPATERKMNLLHFAFFSFRIRYVNSEDKRRTIKRSTQRTSIVGTYNDRSNVHRSNLLRSYYEYVTGTFYWRLLYNPAWVRARVTGCPCPLGRRGRLATPLTQACRVIMGEEFQGALPGLSCASTTANSG